MGAYNPDGSSGGSSGPTGTPGDAVANPAAIPESMTFGLVWDPDAGTWRRAMTRNLGDVIADPSNGPAVMAGLYAYSPGNGAFIRLKTMGSMGDGSTDAYGLGVGNMLFAPAIGGWFRVRGGGAGDLLGAVAEAQPASTPSSQTSGANAANTITLAAGGVGQAHRLTMLTVSWSGAAATAGTLTVSDGATPILVVDIPLTLNTPFAPPLPPGGIKGTANTAMTITVAAGGAGSISKLSVAKLTGG